MQFLKLADDALIFGIDSLALDKVSCFVSIGVDKADRGVLRVYVIGELLGKKNANLSCANDGNADLF